VKMASPAAESRFPFRYMTIEFRIASLDFELRVRCRGTLPCIGYNNWPALRSINLVPGRIDFVWSISTSFIFEPPMVRLRGPETTCHVRGIRVAHLMQLLSHMQYALIMVYHGCRTAK
jgi:hypothetical protein